MPRTLPYNRRHYEEARNCGACWTSKEQRRLETVCTLTPGEAKVILDVGSGGGKFVTALRDRGHYVVATDCSAAAMSLYGGERVLCDAAALPFPDGCFDMVTCTEVLEHLDDERLAHALREIARLARSYVLISVPNDEDLNQCLVKCHSCGQYYTLYGHIQTFQPGTLDNLLPGFDVVRKDFGDEEIEYNRLLLWVRQRIGARWAYWDCAICPACGEQPRRLGRRGIVALGCDFLNNRIPWRPRRRTPMYVLYRRTDSTQPPAD